MTARAPISARLAARLRAEFPAIVAEGRAPVRVSYGVAQVRAGAWSWMLDGDGPEVGSYDTMAACLRAPRLVLGDRSRWGTVTIHVDDEETA